MLLYYYWNYMNKPIPTIWDNWVVVETDYKLGDFWEVTEMIKKMPKLDLVIKNYSQYDNKRYFTGCTGMWWINAMATINNYDFTWNEISEIYDIYEEMWWKPWSWWARGYWLLAVSKRWNKKFPKNKMLFFLEDIFSYTSEMVFDKLWIMWVSIRVDSNYWKDVRQDLKLDWDKYVKSLWHATTMMYVNNYICVDSVPRTTWWKAMVYEYWDINKIRALVKNGNLRKDVHIIVMENWLKEKLSQDEINRLTKFKELLETVIKCNSDMRHLTTQQSEKDRLHKENIFNRWKLKVIDSMLNL